MAEDVQQQVTITGPLRRLIAHPEITDCELAETRRKFYDDDGTERRAREAEGLGIDSITATNDDVGSLSSKSQSKLRNSRAHL